MLETSKDLLFIVISFCVLIFTGFLAWCMYYLAMILKQSNEVVADVRRKLETIDTILNTIREKVALSAATLSAVAKMVTQILNHFKGRADDEEEAVEATPLQRKKRSRRRK